MAERLRDMGAEVLAMPCNTAHAHAAAIRAAGPPFIDMIEATVEAARATGARRIGVLATPGGTALYVEALGRAGLEPATLEGADERAFMAAVLGFKAGAKSEEIKKAYKALVKIHHPDANGGDKTSEERLRAIIAAYSHLKQKGFVVA